MADREILLEIESRVENVPLVGLAADRVGRFFGMKDSQARAWQLAVVEAVNNVIEHSYGYESNHRVRIRLQAIAQRMCCEVSDTGKPIPEEVLSRLRADGSGLPAAEDLAESGYGMQLIATLADELDYTSRPGCNTLRIAFSIAASD